MKRTHFLFAAILFTVIVVLLCAFWAYGQRTDQSVLNAVNNASVGAMQVQASGRGLTSPNTTSRATTQTLLNTWYDESCGCLKVYVDSSSGDIPFINTTSLTDGDVLYYDSTGDEWLNAQGQVIVSGIGTSPVIQLENPTNEDTSGGRESALVFKGFQSGGEESTLAKMIVDHYGGGDNERGRFRLQINEDADGDSPTTMLTMARDTVSFQPGTDSSTYFRIFDADGGTPIINIDSTNERVGFGTTAPGALLEVRNGGAIIRDDTGNAYFTIRSATNSNAGFNFLEDSVTMYRFEHNGASNYFQLYDVANTATRWSVDYAGNITNHGGQIIHRTDAGAADYNPSVLTSDYLITANNSAAARAITISTEDVQSGSTDNPRIFLIKDEYGNAAAQNLTISLESGNIDGAASQIISTDYGAIQLYCDGTNCYIY